MDPRLAAFERLLNIMDDLRASRKYMGRRRFS